MGFDKKVLDRLIAAADPKSHKSSVRFATSVALAAYNRVGNTITATSDGALSANGGVTPAEGDEFLLNSDGSDSDVDNGIWVVTDIGDGSSPFVLNRRADANADDIISSGLSLRVEEGTYAGKVWYLQTIDPIVLNTTPLVFAEDPSGASGTLQDAYDATVAGGGDKTIDVGDGTDPVRIASDTDANPALIGPVMRWHRVGTEANGVNLYFGDIDPNGAIVADIGSVYVHKGLAVYPFRKSTIYTNTDGVSAWRDLGETITFYGNLTIDESLSNLRFIVFNRPDVGKITITNSILGGELNGGPGSIILDSGGFAIFSPYSPAGFNVMFYQGRVKGGEKSTVRFATDTALAAYGRVGNTITASANGALAANGGVTPIAGDEFLLNSDGSQSDVDNGIWVVTDIGDGSNPFILDRRVDANDVSGSQGGIMETGTSVRVREGTYAGKVWYLESILTQLNFHPLVFSLENSVIAITTTAITALGSTAGDNITSGTGNTAVGVNALTTVTTQNNSTAVGFNALTTSTGEGNTALGSGTLDANTTGDNNTAVGNTALGASILTSGNTAVGANAMGTSVGSIDSTAVGLSALEANTASGITGVGARALDANTSGNRNTAVGADALSANTTASDSTAVGFDALRLSTGSNNTAVGSRTLDANVGGLSNTAVGHQALSANTAANANTAVGKDALLLSDADNNTAVGFNALDANTSGAENVAVGSSALSSASTVNGNTAVGYLAGFATTGSNNTLIGHQAGDLITSGDNNIMIGKDTDPSLATDDNKINIGGSIIGETLQGGGNGQIAFRRTITDALAANGTDITSTAIILNHFTRVITVGGGNTAVRLPSAVAGLEFVIFNNGGGSLQIFPNSIGDGMNEGGVDLTPGDPATQADGVTNHYIAYDTIRWVKF